ncbi:hypothetical protein M0Q97_13930 [Candidatus Dojkabacteria bacterium]|jgi:hypothetical protein|nr:hypothetical protein [Candidatus Dojkabacteria bacterium]
MKYKIGDYVLLDLDEIKKNNVSENFKMILPHDNYAKIIEIGNMKYPYFVKIYDDMVFFNNESEIIRLLTPEEIIDFESKINKYNREL